MKSIFRSAAVGAALTLAMISGKAMGQVQHGIVNVVENDALDTAASVTATRVGGSGVWSVVADRSSRGDVALDFGFNTATTADITSGVLIVSPYEVERTSPGLGGGVPYYGVSMSGRTGDPASPTAVQPVLYSISTWQAGGAIAPNSDNAEVNLNSTLVYFPLNSGFIAGAAYNINTATGLVANNAVLNQLVGSNLELRTPLTYTGVGTEFLDYTVSPAGFYLLSSDTIDWRRDGVILTSGGKDEDNRAAWITGNLPGEAYFKVQDIQSDGTGTENDPIAFAFIPEGTTGVTMGVVSGSAKKLFSQGDFTVSLLGAPLTNGTFRLTIAGESPSTGTLIASPAVPPGLAGNSGDNPLWIAPDGDGWLLTTRDQPAMTLQDLGAGELGFSFAFFKNGVNIVPGTPSRTYLERLDDVSAARFVVTEFTPDNGAGDMDTVRSAGSDILDVIGTNRGDNSLSYLKTKLAASYDNSLDTFEGFILGSVSEFFRDNTTTGGVSGWSTFSFDNGDAVSHGASITGGEINSNFAVVHFPAARNFVGASDIGVAGGLLSIPVPGSGSAATDGVLMAINWDNNNRSVSVTSSGPNYDITAYEAQNITINAVDYTIGAVATDSVEIGYVYLPYSTPGLIAGQISADGSVVSNAGTFSITTGTDAGLGFPVFELTIPGVDARNDGVLLLNATSGPIAMAWEAGENGEFEIAGLDLLTQTPGLAAFAFAYIPFEGFGVDTGGPTCEYDFNQDENVDLLDAQQMAQVFVGLLTPESNWLDGDLNGDENADLTDAQILAAFVVSGNCNL